MRKIMESKPHGIDWANLGVGGIIIGALGWLSVGLNEVKVEVAETRGAIQYETQLLKELNEEYQEHGETLENHEKRLVRVEAVLELRD